MDKWKTVVFRVININTKYIFPLLCTYVKYMPEQKRIWLLFKETCSCLILLWDWLPIVQSSIPIFTPTFLKKDMWSRTEHGEPIFLMCSSSSITVKFCVLFHIFFVSSNNSTLSVAYHMYASYGQYTQSPKLLSIRTFYKYSTDNTWTFQFIYSVICGLG